MSQWFAHVGGQQYGPVSEPDLRVWIAQGRVKPTDNVWCEGMANWIPAAQALSATQTTALATNFPPATPYYTPHRGTTVLVLGILGLAVCPILGIIAWVMGNNDLREMAAGRMDPSGQGNTTAGRVCGMIAGILMIVGFSLIVLCFLGPLACAAVFATAHG